MSRELNYYTTGRVVQFRGNIPQIYEITNDKLVTCFYDGDAIVLSIVPLNSEGAQIVTTESRATIQLGIQYPSIWTGVDRNKLLITVYSSHQRVSLIIVVDVNTYQYNRYWGPDFQSRPIGIEGSIIYLSHRVNDQAIITGFEYLTSRNEFRYVVDNSEIYGMLGRTPNGALLAAVLERRLPDGTLAIRIVNIYNEDVLIEIEGDVRISSVRENGVFFTQGDGDYYFTDYQAITYRLNFVDDGLAVSGQRKRIVGSSESGDNIWVGPIVPFDGETVINYKLSLSQNS